MDAEAFRKRVKAVCLREEANQGLVARLSNIELHRYSSLLSGVLVITPKTMRRIEPAVQFIEMLAQQCHPIPVCFHSWERLAPLWLEFERSFERVRAETEKRAAVQV